MNKLFDKIEKIVTGPSLIPADKMAHGVTGLILGLAFGAFPWLALTFITLAAIGKEFYDWLANRYAKTAHEVSFMDAAATFIGGGIGILAIHGLQGLL